MKRVITFTMDIDESTHRANITQKVTENGKVKKEWTPPQGVSTALACIEMGRRLLEDLNDHIIDALRKEEQK